MVIPTLREGPRGCGFRKPGGLYLRTLGGGESCPLLPAELRVCSSCGAGVKPSRGWTWIEPRALIDGAGIAHGSPDHFTVCPLTNPPDRAGLIWIGAQFYSPESFVREAEEVGVSRRISSVPRDFKLGETFVFFAHRSGSFDPCSSCADGRVDPECEICEGLGRVPVPAVFYLCRPDRIEYVVTDEETEEELEALVERGISPVRVERVVPQIEIEIE